MAQASDSQDHAYPTPSFRTQRSGVRNLKSVSTRPERESYVYILTNSVRTLYVGVTNDLVRRVYEHKHKLVPGFTEKYNVTWLAYYEAASDIRDAIAREKQIKAWRRSKKMALIDAFNPQWKDLSLGWYDASESPS